MTDNKEKITPELIFLSAENLLPTREILEARWWPVISSVEMKLTQHGSVRQIKDELMLLMYFALELSLVSSFRPEVWAIFDTRPKEGFYGQLLFHGKKHLSEILGKYPKRQEQYEIAWESHSDPTVPHGYSVAKQFLLNCELEVDADQVSLLAVTNLFTLYINSLVEHFKSINAKYEIVASLT